MASQHSSHTHHEEQMCCCKIIQLWMTTIYDSSVTESKFHWVMRRKGFITCGDNQTFNKFKPHLLRMWLRLLKTELKDVRKPQWLGSNGPLLWETCLLSTDSFFLDFYSHRDREDILMKYYTSECLFKFWLSPDQICWIFPFPFSHVK